MAAELKVSFTIDDSGDDPFVPPAAAPVPPPPPAPVSAAPAPLAPPPAAAAPTPPAVQDRDKAPTAVAEQVKPLQAVADMAAQERRADVEEDVAREQSAQATLTDDRVRARDIERAAEGIKSLEKQLAESDRGGKQTVSAKEVVQERLAAEKENLTQLAAGPESQRPEPVEQRPEPPTPLTPGAQEEVAAPEPAPREQWQMTRDEHRRYAEPDSAHPDGGFRVGGEAGEFGDRERADEFLDGEHRSSVQHALADGLPVPPDVVAEYPDLAAQYPPIRLPPPTLGEVPAIPAPKVPGPVQMPIPLAAQAPDVLPGRPPAPVQIPAPLHAQASLAEQMPTPLAAQAPAPIQAGMSRAEFARRQHAVETQAGLVKTEWPTDPDLEATMIDLYGAGHKEAMEALAAEAEPKETKPKRQRGQAPVGDAVAPAASPTSVEQPDLSQAALGDVSSPAGRDTSTVAAESYKPWHTISAEEWESRKSALDKGEPLSGPGDLSTRSDHEHYDRAAHAASSLTRKEYEGAGWQEVVSYDIARTGATDRGLPLVRNVDIDDRPDNPAAAILKMIDDARAEAGEPRRHEDAYRPREYVTGGEKQAPRPEPAVVQQPPVVLAPAAAEQESQPADVSLLAAAVSLQPAAEDAREPVDPARAARPGLMALRDSIEAGGPVPSGAYDSLVRELRLPAVSAPTVDVPTVEQAAPVPSSLPQEKPTAPAKRRRKRADPSQADLGDVSAVSLPAAADVSPPPAADLPLKQARAVSAPGARDASLPAERYPSPPVATDTTLAAAKSPALAQEVVSAQELPPVTPGVAEKSQPPPATISQAELPELTEHLDITDKDVRGFPMAPEWKYVPKEAELIGSGAEAQVFRQPDADEVYRVETQQATPAKTGAKQRPNIDSVLQPTGQKEVVYPSGRTATVERLPYAPSFTDVMKDAPEPQSYEETPAAQWEVIREDLKARLAEEGYEHGDLTPRNVGKRGDKWVVIDPGGLQKMQQSPVSDTPPASDTTKPEQAVEQTPQEKRIAEAARPKQPHEMTREEFAASAIPAEEASEALRTISGGDERSKHAGKPLNLDTFTKEAMVQTRLPLSAFPEDVREGLADSTNAERVQKYAAQQIDTPVHAVPRKGRGFGIMDGGHRTMAALARGDESIPAMVPVSAHENIVAHALASGQHVPAEVLADYPELAKRAAEQGGDTSLPSERYPSPQVLSDARESAAPLAPDAQALPLSPVEIEPDVSLTAAGALEPERERVAVSGRVDDESGEAQVAADPGILRERERVAQEPGDLLQEPVVQADAPGGLFEAEVATDAPLAPPTLPRGDAEEAAPPVVQADAPGGLFESEVLAETPPPAQAPSAPTSETQTPIKVDRAPEAPIPNRVYSVPLQDIHRDPERFQYKMSTNKKGVTDKYAGVPFKQKFAGVLGVWLDPEDKKTYVVEGHHRLEMAERTPGIETLDVKYMDAPTVERARAEGALSNIAGGQGTAMDAGKFMRETGKTSKEDFRKEGVSLKSDVASKGLVLSQLEPSLFEKVSRGQMEEETALAIGKHLKLHSSQIKLAEILRKKEEGGKRYAPKVIEEMAKEMAATPSQRTTEQTLFGDMATYESLFADKNELKSAVRGDFSKNLNDFKVLSSERRADNVSSAGNRIDVDANKKIADEQAETLAVFDKLVNRKGPIADVLNQGAADWAAAKTKAEKDAVRERTLAAVSAAVKSELENPTAAFAASKPGTSAQSPLSLAATIDEPEPATAPPASVEEFSAQHGAKLDDLYAQYAEAKERHEELEASAESDPKFTLAADAARKRYETIAQKINVAEKEEYVGPKPEPSAGPAKPAADLKADAGSPPPAPAQPAPPPSDPAWIKQLVEGKGGDAGNAHVLIEGESGSGKSLLAKKLAFERMQQGQDVHVVDTHSPEAWGGAKNVFQGRDAGAESAVFLREQLESRKAESNRAKLAGEDPQFEKMTIVFSDFARIMRDSPELQKEFQTFLTEARKFKMSVIADTTRFTGAESGMKGIENVRQNFGQKVQLFPPYEGGPRTAKVGGEVFQTPDLPDFAERRDVGLIKPEREETSLDVLRRRAEMQIESEAAAARQEAVTEQLRRATNPEYKAEAEKKDAVREAAKKRRDALLADDVFDPDKEAEKAVERMNQRKAVDAKMRELDGDYKAEEELKDAYRENAAALRELTEAARIERLAIEKMTPDERVEHLAAKEAERVQESRAVKQRAKEMLGEPAEPQFDPFQEAEKKRDVEVRREQVKAAYESTYGKEAYEQVYGKDDKDRSPKSAMDAGLDLAQQMRGTLGGAFGPLAGAVLDVVTAIRKAQPREKSELRKEAERRNAEAIGGGKVQEPAQESPAEVSADVERQASDAVPLATLAPPDAGDYAPFATLAEAAQPAVAASDVPTEQAEAMPAPSAAVSESAARADATTEQLATPAKADGVEQVVSAATLPVAEGEGSLPELPGVEMPTIGESRSVAASRAAEDIPIAEYAAAAEPPASPGTAVSEPALPRPASPTVAAEEAPAAAGPRRHPGSLFGRERAEEPAGEVQGILGREVAESPFPPEPDREEAQQAPPDLDVVQEMLSGRQPAAVEAPPPEMPVAAQARPMTAPAPPSAPPPVAPSAATSATAGTAAKGVAQQAASASATGAGAASGTGSAVAARGAAAAAGATGTGAAAGGTGAAAGAAGAGAAAGGTGAAAGAAGAGAAAGGAGAAAGLAAAAGPVAVVVAAVVALQAVRDSAMGVVRGLGDTAASLATFKDGSERVHEMGEGMKSVSDKLFWVSPALGVLGSVAGEAVVSVARLDDAVKSSADRLAQYDAGLAAQKAMQEVTVMMRDFNRAQTMGSDIAAANQSRFYMEQKLADLSDKMMPFIMKSADNAFKILNGILTVLEKVSIEATPGVEATLATAIAVKDVAKYAHPTALALDLILKFLKDQATIANADATKVQWDTFLNASNTIPGPNVLAPAAAPFPAVQAPF